jgi:hypothetical protein
LIVDDIWEVYGCLGNEQANYAAAAEHTQSFKDEWELLQAGAVALKEETSEWKRLIESDGFSVDGRTFQWCGKPYSLRESASRVVRVLHDAYLRGTQFIHEQYIKEEAEVQSDMRTLVRDNGLSKLIIPEIDSNGTRIKGKWGLIPRGK